jgi:hypothetical protein
MGVSASLHVNAVSIAPGQAGAIEMKVRNTGTVVDQFSFQALGEAAGWISVEPAQVSLFPGGEESVRVWFRPPRASTTLAGPTPFGIKVVSQEDSTGSVVEEGVVTVEPFDDRTAELIPRTSRGRGRGRHDLAIDNRGNTRVNASVTGVDPEGTLRFEFEPPAVAVEPGTAQFGKVSVQPASRFWRGAPKTLPFQLLIAEEGKAPVAVDGTMLQEPVLPKWLWKAVLALLALILLLVLLFLTVLKPVVKSAAKDAVKKPVAEAKQAAAAAQDAAKAAGAPAPAPAPSGGATTTTAAGSGSGSGATTTTVASGSGGSAGGVGDSFDTRLAPAPAGGANDTKSFTVPAGKTFSLTDFGLQNPGGDTGQVLLKRSGTVVWQSALENFRDLDEHFVTPIVFTAGQSIDLTVSCGVPGGGAPNCSAAATIVGTLR